ncbi:class II D-tagatose-bisphosphate aldolase, non-catalytic subunit [Gluconobacter morbifer]|uniref:Putative tagatose 6-phosphate kinase Agaz n=1 Tax=Gluconobacter morbifer G707 TaxID=1088869 RepID=G6XL29_9PROT|nr:class II D-tagatose-bisphosphate aldolase, non-catalytic subunit [Gluconobacter morbifer]EHH67457.1 putative tagatose 6-phosphate kinase Agaz [Gluconobacter morbifer G707]
MHEPTAILKNLVKQVHDPAIPKHERCGITSVCSAHPIVLEAALRRAASNKTPVLIEATCNQVNQEGGYTGMTPADFCSLIASIAAKVGCPMDSIILGGDHLGPNPWKHLPPNEALVRAGEMVESYAAAGFLKLHLDTSMGCAEEPAVLADAVVAERAALLAARAEAVAPGKPVYVVGTEVPVPGGALETLDHLIPTTGQAARSTAAMTREIFSRTLSDEVWSRVIALVVQPGVEFSAEETIFYQPGKAKGLVDTLGTLPGMVFEAHSTDYQTVRHLRALVEDGFSVLKVGPALTFALREALFSLDELASILQPGRVSLVQVLEDEMQAEPSFWQGHYDPAKADMLRLYGYSDRIRYYWARPRIQRAVSDLLGVLEDTGLPDPLVSQFLPKLYERVRSGEIPCEGMAMLLAAVGDVLDDYGSACAPRRVQ